MTPSELALILALVRKEAAKVKPADGLPGVNGVDGGIGPHGVSGRDGIDAVLPEFTIISGHLFAGDVDLGEVVGRDGQDGTNGQDGTDGRDGVNGTDGRDGKDGLNGVGIREIYVDPDDGHLYVEFTNGRVTDAGLVKGKPGRDGKSGHGGGLVIQSGGGSGIADTFETVSKNLSASGAVMGYTDGDLTTVTYSNGIVKTLAYSLDGLSSVTLSGNTPGGIALVKTLQYNSPDLSGFTYS